MSEILDRELGIGFVSLGTMWQSNKKFLVGNMFCVAALWGRGN